MKRPKRAKKKGGGGLSLLHHPEYPLKGKRLAKASNELTRIELRPAIKGYNRQAQAIERARDAAGRSLTNLGITTGNQVKGAYDALQGSSDQTYARQQALAGLLNKETADINNRAAANLQAQQTGQLGGITEALKARNVDPGGSAAQAALAQQAQAQQQQAAQNAQATGAFANAQGGALTGMAAGMAHASQMAGREAQADIASLIASRIADSNQTHNEARIEALGKAKDAKALWGATRLKNLLELRGGEREYDLARNPGTKKNVMIYKGLPKHKTVDVNNRYKGLPKPGTSGGSKRKKPKRLP